MKQLFLILATILLITGCASGNVRSRVPGSYLNDLSMKYGEVIAEIEPKAEKNSNLGLDDRFLLCRAYSMTRNYSKLFPCLDQLQSLLDDGAQESNWLTGYTIVPSLLRAEALIELGQYDQAVEQAEFAYRYAKERGIYDHWIKASQQDILTALGMAYAYSGNKQKAEEFAEQLKNLSRFGQAHEYQHTCLARLYFVLGRYKDAAAVAKATSILGGIRIE